MMKSFTDEMLKIAAAGWPIEAGKQVLKAGKGISDVLGTKGTMVAIPATAVASVLGWEKAKQMKHRYDIGKLVEESQNRG